jgi:hypothetical protein
MYKFEPRTEVKKMAEKRTPSVIAEVIHQEAIKGYTGFTVGLTDSSELHGIRRSFLYSAVLRNRKSLEKAGYKIVTRSEKNLPKSLTLVWGHK